MSILTFDIGGSFIKYAKMEENGTILYSDKVKTPMTDIDAFYKELEDIYVKYQADVDGLAFSLPGIVDSETGDLVHGGALMFNIGRNFFDDVRYYLDLPEDMPISVENDAYCAALAEVWLGNLKDVDDGAVILLGTGVGGALIKDGKLHKGSHNFAGEFSFNLSEEVMEKGLSESFAYKGSVPNFANRVAKAKGLEEMTGEEAFDLINQQDPDVMPVFEDYVKTLGMFIFNLQGFFDPQKVLIGGGVSKQPILLSAIKMFIDSVYDLIPIPMPKAELDTCKHFNDSNLYGALYHYLVMHDLLIEK